MRYLRPLPHAAATGPRLAGGWMRFDVVEVLERGRAPTVLPVSDIPETALAPLIARRAPRAGIAMDTPRIMGILNVTPDSFSDGGRFLATDAARHHAAAMAHADLIDVGGESTRPGATEVAEETEIARVVPVVAELRGVPVSIDTRKSAVAHAALMAGATMVNDVSALTFDPAMASVVAQAGCGV